MRLFNLFLVTLLCLAIPLHGIAGMLVTKTPCPAESAGMVATTDTAGVHGCCNDADTAAKTGKACKAEQNCQPVSPGLIIQAENQLPAPLGVKITLANSRLALTFEPSATWRPPTLI